jgi:hypothetical protein
LRKLEILKNKSSFGWSGFGSRAVKEQRQNREITEKEQGKNKETFDKSNTLKNKSDVEVT